MAWNIIPRLVFLSGVFEVLARHLKDVRQSGPLDLLELVLEVVERSVET